MLPSPRDIKFGKSARHWLYHACLEHPRLRSVYLAARPRVRMHAPRSTTRLVLEGYPRSANTYALAAFQVANGASSEVSSHLHSARSLLWAVQHNIPAVALLRDPLNAIASQLCRYPTLSPRLAVREYVRFHATLLPVVDQLVVAPFEVVTRNFGAVIAEVNRRWGCGFVEYAFSQDNETRARALVEGWEREDNGGRSIREHTVARPSRERTDVAESLKPTIRATLEFPLAELLYHTFHNRAPRYWDRR